MRAYLIVGTIGAALFCGCWALISRAIPAQQATDQSPQKPETKSAETKPEEKKPEADKKKKPEAHKTIVQQGQGNVNIDQHRRKQQPNNQ